MKGGERHSQGTTQGGGMSSRMFTAKETEVILKKKWGSETGGGEGDPLK